MGIGCHAHHQKVQPASSYEERLKIAERELRKGKIFEARRLAVEVLEMHPGNEKAEKLIAQTIDRQVTQQKLVVAPPLPEETSSLQRRLHTKTLLERSRSLLEQGELEEALRNAEEVFRYDAGNTEASHLIDNIRERAKKEAREEQLFLEQLYQEEIDARIKRYLEEAKYSMDRKKWGPARLALEKVLLLEPTHREGKQLLSLLEQRERK